MCNIILFINICKATQTYSHGRLFNSISTDPTTFKYSMCGQEKNPQRKCITHPLLVFSLFYNDHWLRVTQFYDTFINKELLPRVVNIVESYIFVIREGNVNILRFHLLDWVKNNSTVLLSRLRLTVNSLVFQVNCKQCK